MNPNNYNSYPSHPYFPQMPVGMPLPWFQPPPPFMAPILPPPAPVEYPLPPQLTSGSYNPFNPYHNMCVYQTNNYYGSNFNSPPAEFPSLNVDSDIFKNNGKIHQGQKKVPTQKGKNQGNVNRVPEIIDLDENEESEGVQEVQPMLLDKKQKTRKQPQNIIKSSSVIMKKPPVEREFEKIPEVIRKKVIADPLEQLQRNLKMPQPEEVRRSNRKRAYHRPDQYKQYVQQQIALPISIKYKKLVFGFPMTEQQKIQLCLTKLRQLKPQIMVSSNHQAKLPSSLRKADPDPEMSLPRYLSLRRANLQSRRFHD